MGMDQVTDYLATVGIPQIAKSLFPDVLTIVSDTADQNAGGDFVKNADSSDYRKIPCRYRVMERHEYRDVISEKLHSVEGYIVAFPKYVVTDGTPERTNVDVTTHRLKVEARRGEPEKIFRIISPRDHETLFEMVCVRDN